MSRNLRITSNEEGGLARTKTQNIRYSGRRTRVRLRDQRGQFIFSTDAVAVLEGLQEELERYAPLIRRRANIALGDWYRGAFSVFYIELPGVTKRRGLDLPRPCDVKHGQTFLSW